MASLTSRTGCTPVESLQCSRETANSAHRRAKGVRFIGTWNVRSLLDSEGPIEVARQSPACHQISEDRRVDLVIRELQRYNISAAALQETKWFGTAAYTVGKSVVLEAGRPTPQPGQSMQSWHLSSLGQP